MRFHELYLKQASLSSNYQRELMYLYCNCNLNSESLLDLLCIMISVNHSPSSNVDAANVLMFRGRLSIYCLVVAYGKTCLL